MKWTTLRFTDMISIYLILVIFAEMYRFCPKHKGIVLEDGPLKDISQNVQFIC